MTFHRLRLLFEVDVLNRFTVEHEFQMPSLERDLVAIPFGRTVNLFRRCDGAIESARQLRVLGLRVVAEISHLQFHPVESWVATHRRAQSATTVPRLAELEL